MLSLSLTRNQTKSGIVAGVDVGGASKGFHVVTLRDGNYHDQFSAVSAGAIADWCQSSGAKIVALDAPCHWSLDGRSRPAERQLMGSGIWCFSSPTRTAATAHPKKYFQWMLAGEELYQKLSASYALFDGKIERDTMPLCFETFPHAIACSLTGRILQAKQKRTDRRRILQLAGVDTSFLTNIDSIDAALCALTAHFLVSKNVRLYGDSLTGFIVVPSDKTTSSEGR